MRKIVTVWAAYANAKGGRPIGKSFSYSSSSSSSTRLLIHSETKSLP